MYSSPAKTVFMKTVARCPSDRSCRDGTGIAPLRERKGDRKTDKDRPENGTARKTEPVKRGQRWSMSSEIIKHLSNSLFSIYQSSLSCPLLFHVFKLNSSKSIKYFASSTNPLLTLI